MLERISVIYANEKLSFDFHTFKAYFLSRKNMLKFSLVLKQPLI
jgi:hypothetical protein